MTLPGNVRLAPLALGAAVALAAAVCGALIAALAYATSPLMPLAAVGAVAVAALAAAMPLQLVYLAILLIPFKLYTIDVGDAGLSLPEGLFVLAGVAWAIRRMIGGHLPFTPSPLGKPYALFLLTIVPGILIAAHPVSVLKMLVMWTAFVLVFQMVVTDGRPETVRNILLMLAVSAAVVGLKAAFDPGTAQPQRLLGIGEVAEGRPGGSFEDPNILATFEALGLPAAVAFALGGNLVLRVVGMVAFPLIVAGLALSLSRGGFLAAAGALLVMLAWRPMRYAALAALVLVLALQVGSGSLSGEVQQTSVVEGRISSVSYAAAGGDPRFGIWRATPEMIYEHPFFGIGANQFPVVSPRYGLFAEELGGSYQHAHNIPLTVAAELGLLGLAALVWATFALVRVLVAAYRRQTGFERGMALAVAAAFTGLALQGVVDYTLSSNTVAAMMFLLAGCAVVLSRTPGEALER
ncbi:MAG TPA: O-antigen ligase family protein [Thermoleophilaceae bacterium]|nr:O-antigen ligase family protein [Thermoleophilaceae bacterium]